MIAKIEPEQNSKLGKDAMLNESTSQASKPRVQSVARASKILFSVADSESGLSAAQIRKITGLPTQATYHLLQSLQALGLLRRSSENRYLLGLRVGELIDGFRNHFSCPDELRALVKKIADKTGETCYASGWFDDDLVTLAAEAGWNPVHASAGPKLLSGSIHARASGKLLLALADPQARDAFFASHDLPALTENTLTTEKALREEFETILDQGFAVDREEYVVGLTCVAVPLRLAGTNFAICISAPTERMKKHFDDLKLQITQEIETLL